MKVAVAGGGWAGLAAAVAATAAGHQVTVFEASRQLGGRARTLATRLPGGGDVRLDNGQHIMVGAYAQTLRLMRQVGADPGRLLLRLPLRLRFPDGGGLSLPDWPAPLDALAGILTARGWTARDRLSLLRTAAGWRLRDFRCAATDSVRQICAGLTTRVRTELIAPLCVAALNTPAERASAQVFLRVLRDTLFTRRGANLLLPRCDLGSVFPEHAALWLHARGCRIENGHRVRDLVSRQGQWLVDGAAFDRVLLACPRHDAARLVEGSGVHAAQWLQRARAMQDEAIATVYVAGGPRLPLPLLALRSGPAAPAQFVFDRAQLGGPAGLLAFVVSACAGGHERVQREVLAQAAALGWGDLEPLQTVVEKRATFACTPGLQRPPSVIAPGLLACGDYIEGPYPATLEGAVRSALAAAANLAPADGAFALPRTV